MRPRRVRLAVAVLIPILMMSLSGCWDSHELDMLFITTAVALDKADDPAQMDIAVQISKTQAKSSDPKQADSSDESMILLKTTKNTMLEGMMEFNRSSSRTLLLQHNQVLVIGSELAKQGIERRIDVFLRERSTRMEVLVIIAEDRAEDVIAANVEQEKLSGMFLSRMMQNLSTVSPYYKVRMLDFASRLLDKTTAPVAPLVAVAEKDGKQEILVTGMAIFKKDKMIGRLDNNEMFGYVWAMGGVEQCEVVADSDLGRAVFQILKMDCKKHLELRQDGGVRATLSVDATLNIGELQGFDQISPDELMPYLIELAQKEIQDRITATFEIVRALNADIYGFGTLIYGKYPKEWRSMKTQWDEIFPDIQFDVQAKVNIPATGQIVNSLGMEEKAVEN
jgi:spore germination protein KC